MFNSGLKYTVLTNYGEIADGIFDYYEEAFNWAVELIKTSKVTLDNMTDEEIYFENSDFCRIIGLEI